MVSPTRWTWVWASSQSLWWTRKPGTLQSVGSQRVRHNWATELNWTNHWLLSKWNMRQLFSFCLYSAATWPWFFLFSFQSYLHTPLSSAIFLLSALVIVLACDLKKWYHCLKSPLCSVAWVRSESLQPRGL